MKCDKCGEKLDFRKMRIKNFLETGDIAIKVWFVLEEWPSEYKNFYTVRREIKALCTDADYADKYIDMLNHHYEDKYMKSERPNIHKDIGYLDHLYAFSMDKIIHKHIDEKTQKIEVVSDRVWSDTIGDLEIEYPLSDKIVMKMLLKFIDSHKSFYPSTFIDTFELDEKQVMKAVKQLMFTGIIKYEQNASDIIREEIEQEGKKELTRF